MEGAVVAGSVTQRAEAALNAGCDMVLICNCPDLADELLQNLDWKISGISLARLARMHGRQHPASIVELHEDPDFMRAVHAVANLGIAEGDLNLA
jgi:beta-N-acetylhexosaminidase